jgi:serine/threonine-protein kinase
MAVASSRPGQAGRGPPHLERALPLASPILRADVQFLTAKALWETRRDRPRALSLASPARMHWQERGNPPKLGEVSQWLTAHSVP